MTEFTEFDATLQHHSGAWRHAVDSERAARFESAATALLEACSSGPRRRWRQGARDAVIRAALDGDAPAAETKRAIEEASLPIPQAVAVPDIPTEAFPAPVLTAHGERGAILSAGGVAVLAGEGGIAKSALALNLAVGVAAAPDGERAPVCFDPGGGAPIFEAAGGPALVVSLEDPPAVTAWRARRLAGLLDGPTSGRASRALSRVHVLELAADPIFGPAPSDDGRAGFYNARPSALDGWKSMWDAADAIRPRLVVIDPVLGAYVGDSNAAAPVREFLAALTFEAGRRNLGVLLIAHSRKDARRGKDADPFDPGHVGGSGHWTDGARGVLTMTWRPDGSPGDRRIAIAKANYGPARLTADIEPIRHDGDGAIVGFHDAGDGWGATSGKRAAKTADPAGTEHAYAK